uniref:peptidylprolyl isomerase n=1 Tax=Oryza glumipatula TaxID=40148 RepID=A0A0D9YAL8_9ORYZ
MAPLPELGEPDKSFHNLWDEEEDDDDDDDDEGEVERLPVPPPHSGLLKWTVLKSIDGNDEECRAFKAWSEFQQSISGFILQDDFLVFVSSRENGIPLTFILGQDDVMHGFDFAVSSMLPGEKAIFTIPSELAMTKTGSPARIPSNNVPLNKTLWFEIELINLFTITDIFDDEGILKKIVKSGVPNRSQFRWSDVDSVFVRYNACLKDGTLVSKSEGVEFSLADGTDAFLFTLRMRAEKEEKAGVVGGGDVGVASKARREGDVGRHGEDGGPRDVVAADGDVGPPRWGLRPGWPRGSCAGGGMTGFFGGIQLVRVSTPCPRLWNSLPPPLPPPSLDVHAEPCSAYSERGGTTGVESINLLYWLATYRRLFAPAKVSKEAAPRCRQWSHSTMLAAATGAD